jgi:hypothetical protein
MVGHNATLVMPSRPRRAEATPPATTKRTPRPAPQTTRRVRITKRSFAAIAVAVLLLSFGISSAARYAFGRSTESAAPALAADGIASLAEVTTSLDPLTPAAPLAASENDDSEPHAEAAPQGARDAHKRRDVPGRTRPHGAKRTTRSPFVNGGDKFDPMNGKI